MYDCCSSCIWFGKCCDDKSGGSYPYATMCDYYSPVDEAAALQIFHFDDFGRLVPGAYDLEEAFSFYEQNTEDYN